MLSEFKCEIKQWGAKVAKIMNKPVDVYCCNSATHSSNVHSRYSLSEQLVHRRTMKVEKQKTVEILANDWSVRGAF